MAIATSLSALVVEDEAVIRMHAGALLADAGLSPIEAATADEARRVLDELDGDVALVVADIDLPGEMDGLALALYVRDRWPGVEVVLASCRLGPASSPPFNALKAFPKPFDETAMRDHFVGVLARRLARDPPADFLTAFPSFQPGAPGSLP
jgi:DNA-binding NtrC family response regulator